MRIGGMESGGGETLNSPCSIRVISCALVISVLCGWSIAQTRNDATPPATRRAGFVHPASLHTIEDLQRAKQHVEAGDHPWIDSWNELIKHPKAQLDYKPAPKPNMGASRQRASADANAAYLCFIRGHVSGDVRYIDHAIEICNVWSAAVDQVPSGADQPGLNGLYTYQFAVVGELLRPQVGNRWAQADFDRFRRMMREYLYPPVHSFLTRHNGSCISHYWANWDASCITALGAMGVLLDDRAIFDEAIDYFKNGAGNGSIKNAVYFIHPGGLGQWQETGRDAEHNALGLGLLAQFCQIAFNQGVDLFSYDNNRLLAGAEYVGKYTLWEAIPYKAYNNCDQVNQFWASNAGRGRLQRPIWELLYNHYVVVKGLNAPYTTQVAELNRPEAYVHDDHFGFGTLMYTLKPSAYPPAPIPSIPSELTAAAGVGRVGLHWSLPQSANCFVVRRSTTPGGPYTELARLRGVIPEFEDTSVQNGTTYYYVVAAENQAGISADSKEISAKPLATQPGLPDGWLQHDIGEVATAGTADYAAINEGTIVVKGTGIRVGGTADACTFVHKLVKGDVLFSLRLIESKTKGAGRGSRIGIAIRASLEPDAPCAAMLLGDLGYRETRFGARTDVGKSMSLVQGNGYGGPPTYFRLRRAGDRFTASQSPDGITWYDVGSASIKMPEEVSVGVVVSAGEGIPEPISLTVDHMILK